MDSIGSLHKIDSLPINSDNIYFPLSTIDQEYSVQGPRVKVR